MYTQDHVVALLSILAEQRKHIETLREELEAETANARRYRVWWQEEEEKNKAFAEQLTQPKL